MVKRLKVNVVFIEGGGYNGDRKRGREMFRVLVWEDESGEKEWLEVESWEEVMEELSEVEEGVEGMVEKMIDGVWVIVS